jgi:hypothetical protein
MSRGVFEHDIKSDLKMENTRVSVLPLAIATYSSSPLRNDCVLNSVRVQLQWFALILRITVGLPRTTVCSVGITLSTLTVNCTESVILHRKVAFILFYQFLTVLILCLTFLLVTFMCGLFNHAVSSSEW